MRNLQLQLVKLNEESREKEIRVAESLSAAWRDLEGLSKLIERLSAQRKSTQHEIKALRDQTGESDELEHYFDHLLRAEERKARIETQYYQAVAEYRKLLSTIHWLKGSLGSASI